MGVEKRRGGEREDQCQEGLAGGEHWQAAQRIQPRRGRWACQLLIDEVWNRRLPSCIKDDFRGTRSRAQIVRAQKYLKVRDSRPTNETAVPSGVSPEVAVQCSDVGWIV